MREPQLPLRRGSESDMLSTAESSSYPRARDGGASALNVPDPKNCWPYASPDLASGLQAAADAARAQSYTGIPFNKKHLLELQVGGLLGVGVDEHYARWCERRGQSKREVELREFRLVFSAALAKRSAEVVSTCRVSPLVQFAAGDTLLACCGVSVVGSDW